MNGALGYELDMKKLTSDERCMIRKQIESYKNDADVILNGKYYRLSNPDSDTYCAWEYISQDSSKVIIAGVILENHGNMPVIYVKPRGLPEGTFYRDIENGNVYASDALMDSGLPLTMPESDYEGFVFRLTLL